MVPHRLRPYLFSRFARIDSLLAAFVRGQLTVALLLGSFYAIALTACGVPMGLLPIFLAVEVIPDIFRTVGNVTADVAVTALARGKAEDDAAVELA